MVVGITSTTLISKSSSEVGRDFLSFPPAVTLAMTEMVDILFKKFNYILVLIYLKVRVLT